MSDIFDHEIDAFERQYADECEPADNVQEFMDSMRATKASPPAPSKHQADPGRCPKCGAATKYKESKTAGPFYGCVMFPNCDGSRRATYEETSKWRAKRQAEAMRVKLALQSTSKRATQANSKPKSLQDTMYDMLKRFAHEGEVYCNPYFARTLVQALSEYYSLHDSAIDSWLVDVLDYHGVTR